MFSGSPINSRHWLIRSSGKLVKEFGSLQEIIPEPKEHGHDAEMDETNQENKSTLVNFSGAMMSTRHLLTLQ